MSQYDPDDAVLVINGQIQPLYSRETSSCRYVHPNCAVEITPHSTSYKTRRFKVHSADKLITVEIELLKDSKSIPILVELCNTPLKDAPLDLLTISIDRKARPNAVIPKWLKPIIKWKD